MQTVKFLLNRFIAGVIVVFGVSILIFLLARVIPGDPARIALGPTASPEQVSALRKDMGLDQPIVVQYVDYIAGALRLDFGESLYTGRPVAEDIAKTLPATLELVFASLALMIFFGILMGVLAAHFKGGWLDNLFRIFALLGVTSPAFVWAIFLMLAFAFALDLFPVSGRLSPNLEPPPYFTGFFIIDGIAAGQWRIALDAFHHLVLPAVALALTGIGQTARLTRINMTDVYDRPYIEMARAFNYHEAEIAFKYAFRPAMIPTLTIIGLEFVAKLGNAFLVESVFVWPGMARYGVQTIVHKDLNGIIAVVLIIAVFFALVNTLVDLLVAYVDPRIRTAVS